MSLAETSNHGKIWPTAFRSQKLAAHSEKQRIERTKSDSPHSGYAGRYVRGPRKATKQDVFARTYEQQDLAILAVSPVEVHAKPVIDVASIFHANSEKWKQDSMFISSISQIVIHPAYQRIIGLGPAAIPFIIRDLEASGDQWFWALESITGANPIAPENVGNPVEMTRQWSAWATQHGYK